MDETRKQHLAEFVAWARKHISGDEKGEAQIFLDRLFQAFGQGGIKEAGAVLEMRVKQEDNKGTAFADLVWKPIVLIEMKKRGQALVLLHDRTKGLCCPSLGGRKGSPTLTRPLQIFSRNPLLPVDTAL